MNDTVANSAEIMGLRAYARHQNVSHGGVSKAIKTGRITKAVIWGKGGRVEGIKWRLADELWAANTDPREAVKTREKLGPPALAGPVQTSASAPPRPAQGEDALPLSRRRMLELGEMSQVLGGAFGISTVAWSAAIVSRFELTPDVALNIVEDGLLVLNDAVRHVLGISPDRDFQMTVPSIIREAMTADGRARVLQAIEAVAPTLRD